MAIQQIRLFGDPVLRTMAEPVIDFDKELRRLVKDLTDTMLAAPGAGLAAPQIGVSLRVFTYNVDGEVGHLINPALDLSDETQDGDEGCLSIPNLAFPCTRALRALARGFNEYGDEVVIEGSEKLARCFQHETDHLDGVLFVDRLDRETRKAALRAIRQADWANGGAGAAGAGAAGAAGAPTIKLSPHPTFGQAR
ncbi:peptide deformylase [Actinocrinis puniceicyclus]|uniref:Peptide deformylase n=1 Tax=Actinocrinis puniceicyclus TaxID=977794 RepID=A0A8J7WN83_9ACTN|nr:peptide deformylase [Actinocrinis puniceicyclus]MBS2965506.1 peptide deformylase [Actinocrinis puniceicyclus]